MDIGARCQAEHQPVLVDVVEFTDSREISVGSDLERLDAEDKRFPVGNGGGDLNPRRRARIEPLST
jgi:hypothetical protein